jgi:hypothetical protein
MQSSGDFIYRKLVVLILKRFYIAIRDICLNETCLKDCIGLTNQDENEIVLNQPNRAILLLLECDCFSNTYLKSN